MPLPPGCYWTENGYFFDPAVGQEILYNEGSSDNCGGRAFMTYVASRPEVLAKQRKEENRRIKASDMKVLGPVIGKLAQVIRKRRAAALSQDLRSFAKSLRSRSRRRRALSID